MSSIDSKLVMVGVAGALFGASAAGLAFLVANQDLEEADELEEKNGSKGFSVDDASSGILNNNNNNNNNNNAPTPSSFRPSSSMLGLATSMSLSPIDNMPALIGSVFQGGGGVGDSQATSHGLDAGRVLIDASPNDEGADDDEDADRRPRSILPGGNNASSPLRPSAANADEPPRPMNDLIETSRPKEEEQILLNLLYSIAEDQARREGVVHRGIICNACQRSPVIGVRYKCANCLDYDICEACEPKDHHDPAHVFVKIRVPLPPLSSPRSVLFAALYVGRRKRRGPAVIQGVNGGHAYQPLSWSQLKRLVKETQFDHYELESLHEQYFRLCSFPESFDSSPGISRDNFNDCLGTLAIGNNLVVRRLFKFYDQNDDGFIDFPEMAKGLSVLIKGSLQDKLPHVFRGYDLDDRGSLSKENLRQMFKAYFSLTVELVKDVVRTCEEDMFNSHYDDGAGKPVSALFTAPIPTELGYPAPLDGTSSNTTGNDSGFPRLDSSLSRSNSGIPNSLSAYYLSPTSPLVGIGSSEVTHGTTPVSTQISNSHCRPVGADRSERLSVSNDPDSSLPKTTNSTLPTTTAPGMAASATTSLTVTTTATVITSPSDKSSKKPFGGENDDVRTKMELVDRSALKRDSVKEAKADHDGIGTVNGPDRRPDGRRCAPMWPVIEAMSQDAVTELVDSFFANASVLHGQRMSYEQFFTLSQSDRSLLAWFEALGTVF